MGGQGSAYGARLAVFWALLSSAPLVLLNGLVAGFIAARVAVAWSGCEATRGELDEECDHDEGQKHGDHDRGDRAHDQVPTLTVRSIAE